MQFINGFRYVRGLSCAIRGQQISLSRSTGLHGSLRSLVTYYHNNDCNIKTPTCSISRSKQGLLLHQIRQRTSSSPMVDHQPSSSGTADSGDSDVVTKYKNLRDELKQMRDLGKSVPEVITDADLEYYASLTTKSGRRKFLLFLFRKENIKRKERQEKLQRRLERVKPKDGDEHIEGTLPPNRLLRKIAGMSMLTGYNWKLASAMKFGPQIAFDFSFDEHMKRPDVINMVSQLTHVLNANKEAKDPFYMHWTGLKAGSMSMVEMQRMLKEFYNIMVNVTETDALEMFPKEKLIYLTGDSRNIMHSFDPDKVYIIGGIVDPSVKTGLTLAKAKRYNISHARFPLDLYLQWGQGGKALTLDQVARILHSIHETGDWVKALENIPKRKHCGLKVTQNFDSSALEKIGTGQDLREKYYLAKKNEMNVGKSRRESRIRNSSRFTFSRAKREFKWDILPETEKDQKKS